MNDQPKTLEEVHATLVTLRKSQRFHNKFPKEVWNSIIELTKALPFQEVCLRLNIKPAYLKRKMELSQITPSNALDFQELSYSPHSAPHTSNVVIELTSNSGLKARIQCPSNSLNFLSSLFGGK